MSTESSRLIEMTRSYVADRRAEAAAKYQELLRRNDPDDADALVEVLADLGRDPGKLNDDQVLAGRIVQYGYLAGNVENLQDELARKHAALLEGVGEAEQARAKLEESIEAKLRPLKAGLAQIEARASEAKHARSVLQSLRDEWAAIEQP